MLGKVVLITGAASGIGAGTAVHFASKGCFLSLVDKDTGLEETRQACVRAGSKEEDILLITADLRVHENLATIVEKTLSNFGKLDVLVNNAGIIKQADLEHTSPEDYDNIMNVNLKAAFFLTQASMPHLIQSKGCVVNVSSIGSKRFHPQLIVYGMSKAALDHFTRMVALDVADKQVRVNAVNPGSTRTPLNNKHNFGGTFEERCKKLVAMRRGGTVDEVAKAIGFLADNEQSSFITGVTLLVDGGSALLGPL